MRHNITVTCLFLILNTGFISAESKRTVRGDERVNTTIRYTDVTIELDRTRFDQGQPIHLKFKVTNTGYRASRYYPFEPFYQTYQFQILDEKAHELQPNHIHSISTDMDSNRNRIVNLAGQRTKEIILHPGESFEKTIDLTGIYDLSSHGQYRIVGYFFPDARKNVFIRSSNTVRIHIDRDNARPAFTSQDSVDSAEEGIAPEEAVYLFLSAELRRNWKNYLKYLDLPRYITSYERFAGQYARGDERTRVRVIDQFRNYLTSEPTDRLKQFKVMSVTRQKELNRATVIVEAKRATGNYSVIYEYTYTLEKARGFWKIIGVVARVAG